MRQSQQAPPNEAPAQTDPRQVLHLLRSAPQELIVEVYWHLVHRLQSEAHEDPSARLRLEQMNQAYAVLVGHRDRLDGETDESHKASPRTSTWLGRLLGRRDTARERSSRRSPSAWELLHLEPSAPPDIVELAYGFCRLRLRSQRGEAAAMELEELQKAYETLKRRGEGAPSEAVPDQIKARAGALPDQMTAQAARVPDHMKAQAEAVPDQMKAHAPPAPAGEVSGSAPAAAPPSVPVATPQPAAAENPTATAAESAPSAPAEVGSAPDEAAVDEQSEVEVKSEQRPSAETAQSLSADTDTEAAPDLAEPAPYASAEERMAELTAPPVLEPGEPQAADSDLAAASAADAQADEGGAGEAFTQPAPGPEASPTSPSEAVAQAQPGPPSKALALLVTESGSGHEMGAAIGTGSFTIGSDPTCDFVVDTVGTKEVGVFGRIWAQGDRFMLHVTAAAPAILVNGESVVWAVLEDGDRLEIWDTVLRFQQIQRSDTGS